MLDYLPTPPWLQRRALTGRARQIARILTKHGLGWMGSQFGSNLTLPFLPNFKKARDPQENARRLRVALIELGPTFVKFGQALSARVDMLPPAYVVELSKLQDEIPPSPYEPFRQVVIEELGAPPEEIFEEFNPDPIASASLGQVYEARLQNGQKVAVKIQRPDIEHTIKQDLQILLDMAEWASQHSQFGQQYDLVVIANEFSFRLLNELDYLREGHNADIIRRNFYNDPCVYIPRIYWKWTTQRVITLEHVGGIKITDGDGLKNAGINPQTVSHNSGQFTLRQLIEFGFFHADPHPGNLFVQPDGTLAVIDFGMVGKFTDTTQEALHRMLMASARGKIGDLCEELVDLGVMKGSVRRKSLSQDLFRIIDYYRDSPSQLLTATDVLGKLMSTALKHRLQMPSDMIMLIRLVTINEGINCTLDPDFKMLDFATPIVRRYLQSYNSPERIAVRTAQSALDGIESSFELPRHAERLLRRMENGLLELQINYDGLRGIISQMERMANRLAISILAGSTIVAFGMVMVVYRPSSWQQFGEFFFGFAFISSLGFGIWLMISILRSGRP
jgi:ubiquinone biosynthesis protein